MHLVNYRSTSPKVLSFVHRPIYNPAAMNRKAALFRLYPTPEQRAQMARIAGACRFVYNVALEQRRDWYRPGRRFSFASQCREVTMLRAEVDWLKACPVHTLQQALKDLDRAYQNWWAGRAEPPTPRKKGINDSFRFPIRYRSRSSARADHPAGSNCRSLGGCGCVAGKRSQAISATQRSLAAQGIGMSPCSGSRKRQSR
jgi:hypothetical protein